MQDKYHLLFAQLRRIEAPQGLIEMIESRMFTLESLKNRQKRRFFGAIAYTSIITLIPASLYALSEFSRSSFGEYISLISSDTDVAFLHWKEFALSLIDSVPLFGMTIVLTLILTSLVAFDLLGRYRRSTPPSLSTRFA
jgi:hypothetical protein